MARGSSGLLVGLVVLGLLLPGAVMAQEGTPTPVPAVTAWREYECGPLGCRLVTTIPGAVLDVYAIPASTVPNSLRRWVPVTSEGIHGLSAECAWTVDHEGDWQRSTISARASDLSGGAFSHEFAETYEHDGVFTGEGYYAAHWSWSPYGDEWMIPGVSWSWSAMAPEAGVALLDLTCTVTGSDGFIPTPTPTLPPTTTPVPTEIPQCPYEEPGEDWILWENSTGNRWEGWAAAYAFDPCQGFTEYGYSNKLTDALDWSVTGPPGVEGYEMLCTVDSDIRRPVYTSLVVDRWDVGNRTITTAVDGEQWYVATDINPLDVEKFGHAAHWKWSSVGTESYEWVKLSCVVSSVTWKDEPPVWPTKTPRPNLTPVGTGTPWALVTPWATVAPQPARFGISPPVDGGCVTLVPALELGPYEILGLEIPELVVPQVRVCTNTRRLELAWLGFDFDTLALTVVALLGVGVLIRRLQP